MSTKLIKGDVILFDAPETRHFQYQIGVYKRKSKITCNAIVETSVPGITREFGFEIAAPLSQCIKIGRL